MWKECVDPPDLPNMIYTFEDTGPLVRFGHSVIYRCVPGTFMEHDRDQEEYWLQCLSSGSFLVNGLLSQPFPSCVQSKDA